MTSLASSLLDFILDLFRDPDAAEAYAADPETALASAGVDATPAEVDDLAPLVAGYAPIPWHCAPGKPVVDHGGQDGHCSDDDHAPHGHPGPAGPPHCDDAGPHGAGGAHPHPPMEPVVLASLQHVSYSHTSIQIDASHDIWVGGDATAIFGDDNVLVDVSDVNVAVGGGHIVDDSTTDDSVDVSGDGNVLGDGKGGIEIENSGNVQHGSGNTVGDDNENEITGVGNTIHGDGNGVGEDNDPELKDVGNDVSGIGNAVGEDSEAGIDVDIENSGNDLSGDGNAIGEEAEGGDYDDHSFTVGDISDVAIGDNASADDIDHSLVVDQNPVVVELPVPIYALAEDAVAH